MSNTNNNLQTQTSSAHHNAIMEAGGKDHLPMLAHELEVVADDEAFSKEKEIDELMALISMSFKKIYKPINNNLKTSSNTRNVNTDNTLRSERRTGYDRQIGQYDNQRAVNVVGARENVVHYMYMAKIQEVTPDDTDNFGPIFDIEPLQKVVLTHKKSTSAGIQFLRGDKLVSWSSKKQDYTSMSTFEAEYVSLSAYYAQVLWMRTQLPDYGFHFDKIPMYCDSKAAIAISCNPVQHSRTKHIDVRYHFIKEQVESRIVEFFFVGTEY
ncbi:hypothetical protein Tco_1094061 [Tanacetum coccineum]|uniref:Uncharacterized protein n=1 Tax=Tanacetum coccineum TaxID=301880 RepID=A0ABQ5IGU3_9ASTR